MSVTKVAVLGGGSFGTSIANVAAKNGFPTHLWMRNSEQAKQTQDGRQNLAYLPGYVLDDNLSVSADLAECVRDADLVMFAVPSNVFKDVVAATVTYLRPTQMVVSTTKGIEPKGFMLMSQILERALPGFKIGVLSGPNFAREMIAGQITGSVIASEHDDLRAAVQQVFSAKNFRVYASDDRHGVEFAGALKNIYAIITGMAAAMGTGKNTEAMLLTRSLAEMARFARKLGADPMTLLGLAGVGDLVLTCTSDKSRNYRFGFLLGQGKSVEDAVSEVGQVVEGLNTLKTVYDKAEELGVYMPLVQGLYAVVFAGQPIAVVVNKLMTAAMSSDVEFRGQTDGQQ